MQTKINEENGSFLICLNETIYSSVLVQQAVQDFSSFCTISFTNSTVTIYHGRKDVKKLAYEFCNYLITLKQNEP